MDVLREREAKDSLERQLVDERKLRGMFVMFIMFICSTTIYIWTFISSYFITLFKYNCLLVHLFFLENFEYFSLLFLEYHQQC